ncbi:hypothetical protein BBta_6842 [Bradyrhizobium sp. BTAi1]|nr:hypothetical protein BBta_6842 [Bradyrhizobium sp. BTAi1]
MNRLARHLSQAFDLVLHHEFAALQLGNTQVVSRWMQESFMQFVFKNFMLTLEFNEMRLKGHSKPPR